MKMSIGVPVLRPDGLYDVSHSYYCGTRCAAHVTSVMAKGPTGWTVHSSTLQSISLRSAPNNSLGSFTSTPVACRSVMTQRLLHRSGHIGRASCMERVRKYV